MQDRLTELTLDKEEEKKLLETYERYKPVIKGFLAQANDRSDEHITSELMFCLQTAQSSAKTARATINRLKECGMLFTANPHQIHKCMEGVRFSKKKSEYLHKARGQIPSIKQQLGLPKEELREWLVENVKGMGPKLASHFMRNIGIYGLAILDIHVQNFMERNNLLRGQAGKLNRKAYAENEKIFLQLAKQLEIPPEELDIAIWMTGNGSGEFYG
ncbi:MAG: hypothetical protein V1887_04285 [Candidatus Aenigmatarchaeota archaeon]